MLETLTSNYNGLALLINTISIIVNGGFVWWTYRQKSKLDKQMEEYKHQLQKEFLKSQLKTTQLFEIYPKLFAEIKSSEGELFIIYGNIKKQRQPNSTEIQSAWNAALKARNFCYMNILFISKEVEILVENVFESFSVITKADSLPDKASIFDDIKDKINILKVQMQKELSNERKL